MKARAIWGVAITVVVAGVVAAPSREARAQARLPATLSIERVEGTFLAGDPVFLVIELSTRGRDPSTIHFDRRQLTFGLDPETARETLCDPEEIAREAQREEFITLTRTRPNRLRIDLLRHCPGFRSALSRAGVHDIRAYYDARLDGWQWGLHARRGRLISEPVGFAIAPRFGPVARGTAISQRVLAYADTDDTIVLMPQTTLSADVADRLTLGASYMADIVSSASVDIVSTATRRLEERRDQVGIGTSYAQSDARAAASLTYSTEPDFESAALLLSGSLDFAQRNTTVSGEYQLRRDDIGVRGDDPLPFSAAAHRGRVDVVQLLDPSTFVQVGFSGAFEHGMLSNPYRYVPVGPTLLLERLPGEIRRIAVAGRLARLIAPGHGLRLEYRLYADDWGVVSHTAELRYNVRLSAIVVRFGYRFYRQGAATFYRQEYSGEPEHFTGDRELGAFLSHGGDVDASWSVDLRGIFRKIGVEGHLGALTTSYDEFPLTPVRTGLLAQAALNAGF